MVIKLMSYSARCGQSKATLVEALAESKESVCMVARNVTDLQILLPMKCPAERTILTHCRHVNLACK